MRLTLFVISAFTLGACAVAPQQSVAPVANAAPAATFDIPMDPGLIRCSSLTNPAALNAATEWTLGQARASILAGRFTDIPDENNLAQTFAAYCSENPASTVRDAAFHWGLAS